MNHVLLTERTETVEHHGFLDGVGSVNVSPDGIVGTQRIDRFDATLALAQEATELRLGHLTDLVVLLGFDVLNHENLLALMDLVRPVDENLRTVLWDSVRSSNASVTRWVGIPLGSTEVPL